MTTTIYYISSDQWWDTDVDVIMQLKRNYRIKAFVLTPLKGNTKYPQKKIKGVNITEIRSGTAITRIQLIAHFLWFALKLRCDKYSVCYFVLSGSSAFLSFVLRCLPVNRTIVCIHNYIEHSGKEIDERIRLCVYQHFENFHFHSSQQYEAFMRDYPHKHAFYTKMPLKDFGKSCGNINIAFHGKRVFTFFGKIVSYKHLEVFIKAAHDVKSQNVVFWIVGSCNNWKYYQDLIGEDVRFITDIRFVNNEEIPDIFTLSDFLVLPYDDATQSGPSLTAINYGLPIIGTRIKPFEDLVEDGINGYLFPVGDVDGLTKVLDFCIKMSDAELRNMKKKQLKQKDLYQIENNILPIFIKYVNEITLVR